MVTVTNVAAATKKFVFHMHDCILKSDASMSSLFLVVRILQKQEHEGMLQMEFAKIDLQLSRGFFEKVTMRSSSILRKHLCE